MDLLQARLQVPVAYLGTVPATRLVIGPAAVAVAEFADSLESAGPCPRGLSLCRYLIGTPLIPLAGLSVLSSIRFWTNPVFVGIVVVVLGFGVPRIHGSVFGVRWALLLLWNQTGADCGNKKQGSEGTSGSF